MKKILSYRFVGIVTLSILLFSFIENEKESFTGESILNECKIEIPLYYSTKAETALKTAYTKYKNVEIVLLTKEKKGNASYTYYYLVGEEGKYGFSAYLVKSSVHNSNSAQKEAFFIDYKPKKHIFYDANCFREKLKSNPQLNGNLFEIK
jgi:hypothetical protein